jgi:hypothetical protein
MIEIIVYDVFSVADTVSKADGGTFDGNVTMAGTFTSKGIDDNADATAITINSSETVMIGRTATGYSNTGAQFTNSGAQNIFVADGDYPLGLNRQTDDGVILDIRKDGTEVGAIQTFSNALQIGSYVGNDAFIQFVSSGIKPTTSAGANRDNGIDLGASNARFKDLYLGGGAYIGGTGSANYLDDYEEGTWTPATSSSSYNTGSSTGVYTKIGRIVIAHFSINFSAVNSSSNSVVVITNFPFTNGGAIASTGTVRESSNTGAVYTTRIATNTTTATMNSMDNVTNGSQRTIRTNENYVGTLIYVT